MNRTLYSRRQIALWGGLLFLVLVPLFVSLGLWQWNKAQAKLDRQARMDALAREAPVAMPPGPADPESLRYRRISVRGEYEPAGQFLVDNRVFEGQAGYHVVTPLKIAGSEFRVLVNRGWIPAGADRSRIPEASPPAGPVSVIGVATVPPERFFTLGQSPAAPREAVWQNLDLQRFRQAVPYPVQPVVLQLDPDAPHGYGRDWPHPDEGADRNRGYALQWFGFAVASLGIWLYYLTRRP